MGGPKNLKISIAKPNTPSPHRRGRSLDKGAKKSGVKKPLTPNSVEKQQKNLQHAMKIEIDKNVRLKAHNKIQKETNLRIIDNFESRDIQFQNQRKLNSNARLEIDYKEKLFERVRVNLASLNPRELFMHKNLQGLVKYAKKLTVELEDQKQKVVMSEQIIADLKKAGSDDMGSLIGMLKGYREKQANSAEEIEKLNQLSVIKDDEIVNLDIEL
jgi:hypothetical protein